MTAKKMDEQEKYIDIISKIDNNYSLMRSMRPLRESSVKRYYEDFSVSACHNSTAIEGNTFTFDETYLLVKEGVTSSNHSIEEHNEIFGYKKGYWFVYEALKKKEPITESFIKKLHRLTVFDKDFAGEYRDVDVIIGNMITEKPTFEPPTYKLVPQAMESFVLEVNKDLCEYENLKNDHNINWNKLFNMLAEHHCKFERIHPFEDGNGRTGRLLLTYELIYLGLLPVDIRYAEKARYYAGLKNYDSKAKYSTNPESKTDGMAKLLAESELRSMEVWNKMFAGFIDEAKQPIANEDPENKKEMEM